MTRMWQHTYTYGMGTRLRYNFWIDPDLLDGLRLVKARDGVLESEQIRRAIADWLKKKQVPAKAARRTKGGR